jgi:hypothetical protein
MRSDFGLIATGQLEEPDLEGCALPKNPIVLVGEVATLLLRRAKGCQVENTNFLTLENEFRFSEIRRNPGRFCAKPLPMEQ